MSVQSVSGAATPWQVLAEARAARAAATPATDGTQSGASDPTNAAAATTAAGNVTPSADVSGTGIAKILADLQSFFTELQSQGGTPPGATAGSASTSQAATPPAPPPADPAATTAAASGSSSSAGTTQTGNDLALQWLSAFQGGWPGALGPLAA